MATFNGKEFLASKKVKVDLSNGQSFEVCEISQETMDELDQLGDDASKVTLKDQLAKLCGVDKSAFEGVGVVELRGVMDFLSDSLLGLK
jgi:hypothetical protein